MDKIKKVLRMFIGLWVMSLGMGVFAGGFIAFPTLTHAVASKMLELTGIIKFMVPFAFGVKIILSSIQTQIGEVLNGQIQGFISHIHHHRNNLVGACYGFFN